MKVTSFGSYYAGSSVTSKGKPSMLEFIAFQLANGTLGTSIRPSLYILAKKFSFAPRMPTTLTVTFKVSVVSSVN